MTTSTLKRRLSMFTFSTLGSTIGIVLAIWLTSRPGEWPQYWYLCLVFGAFGAVPLLLPDSVHERLRTPLSANGSWLAVGVTVGVSVLLFFVLLAVIR